MKKDFQEIPLQFKRVDKDQPFHRPLPVMVELLENTYQLLFHPVFDEWGDYNALNIFDQRPNGFPQKFNRTYFERTIYFSKGMGNPKIGTGRLSMHSEGFEHAIEKVELIWDILNKTHYGEGFPNTGFDGGLHKFRIVSASELLHAAIYFGDTCNQMMLTHKKNDCIEALNKIKSDVDREKWLHRMKTNIEQRKDQLDDIVYNGLTSWVDLELQYFKKVNGIDEISVEIRRAMEQYLKEKKSRISNSKLVTQLMDGQLDEFCQCLSDLAIDMPSFHDTAGEESERVYHVFLLTILNSLKDEYRIESNKECGIGRFDIMLTPNHLDNTGVIIEVKKIKTEQLNQKEFFLNIALDQIKNNRYYISLQNAGHEKAIAIGAVFCGKQLFLKHEILDFKTIGDETNYNK